MSTLTKEQVEKFRVFLLKLLLLHDEREHARALCDMALRSLEAPVSATVAHHMVLVPREPTEAMLVAIDNADPTKSHITGPRHFARRVYDAMLAAAPAASPQPTSELAKTAYDYAERSSADPYRQVKVPGAFIRLCADAIAASPVAAQEPSIHTNELARRLYERIWNDPSCDRLAFEINGFLGNNTVAAPQSVPDAPLTEAATIKDKP